MRIARRAPAVLAVGLALGLTLLVVTIAASASSTAQGGPPNLVAGNDLSNIVTPMEMRITAVGPGAPGQSSIVVTLNATNYIGTNANYANAVVTLQSLKLTVNYQYQSSSGGSMNGSITVTVSPSFVMLTGQQKTLPVTVSPLQGVTSGKVTVEVSGWYNWTLSSTNSDGSQQIVNGGGRLLELPGAVTIA